MLCVSHSQLRSVFQSIVSIEIIRCTALCGLLSIRIVSRCWMMFIGIHSFTDNPLAFILNTAIQLYIEYMRKWRLNTDIMIRYENEERSRKRVLVMRCTLARVERDWKAESWKAARLEGGEKHTGMLSSESAARGDAEQRHACESFHRSGGETLNSNSFIKFSQTENE